MLYPPELPGPIRRRGGRLPPTVSHAILLSPRFFEQRLQAKENGLQAWLP